MKTCSRPFQLQVSELSENLGYHAAQAAAGLFQFVQFGRVDPEAQDSSFSRLEWRNASAAAWLMKMSSSLREKQLPTKWSFSFLSRNSAGSGKAAYTASGAPGSAQAPG